MYYGAQNPAVVDERELLLELQSLSNHCTQKELAVAING